MKIQSAARMLKQKQKFQKDKKAAVKIQSVVRKLQQINKPWTESSVKVLRNKIKQQNSEEEKREREKKENEEEIEAQELETPVIEHQQTSNKSKRSKRQRSKKRPKVVSDEFSKSVENETEERKITDRNQK